MHVVFPRCAGVFTNGVFQPAYHSYTWIQTSVMDILIAQYISVGPSPHFYTCKTVPGIILSSHSDEYRYLSSGWVGVGHYNLIFHYIL